MSRTSAPTAARQAALHPAASVWVAASAGTGKTRVLTDRLLTLMLAGTDPARILCLTFTAAARAGREPELAEALALVAKYTAEERFGELMTALVRERSKLRNALGGGEAALRRRLCAALSVLEDATIESVAEAFCAMGACDE